MDTLRSVEKSARDLAHGRNWIVGIAQLLAVIVFPLIESLVLRFWTELYGIAGGWAKLIVAAVVIAHVGFGSLVFLATRKESFYFQFLDLRRERDDAEQQLAKERDLRKQAEWSRVATRSAIQALEDFYSLSQVEDVGIEDVRRGVEGILLAAIQKRSEVFGFVEQAKHNISVYRYNPDTERLEPCYRSVDDRIQRQDRTWASGHGHIGLCYLRGKTMISSKVENAELLLEQMDERDRLSYRSLASAPIFTIDETDETNPVWGVLIVTSSQSGQLTRRRHEALMVSLASTLAFFFHVVESQTDVAVADIYSHNSASS